MPRYTGRIIQTRVLEAYDEDGEDGVEAEDESDAEKKLEEAYYADRVSMVDSSLEAIKSVREIR